MQNITSVAHFEQITEEIKQSLKAEEESTTKIIVGLGSCGIASGGRSVWKAIHEKLQNDKIDAKVVQTGCIGMCFNEVLVDIKKPNLPRICYKQITPELAIELINDCVVGDAVRADLAECAIGRVSYDGCTINRPLEQFYESRCGITAL